MNISIDYDEMGEYSFEASANFITHNIQYFLKDIGIENSWINFLNLLIILLLATTLVFFLQKVIHHILAFFLKKINRLTNLDLFDYMVKNRLPHFLALVVPYTFIINIIPTVFSDYPFLIKPAMKFTDIYIVFMIIWTTMSVIRSFIDVLQNKPAFHNKPMKSYIQVIQIILYIIGIVAIFSILTGKSATVFFTAMGAASAVLMLMFKDTIMGFVSSIQISTNEMAMLGDWITMNKYGADGNVEEINLTTVKVRNFDKTITTIPTYALISDSFQNWRGMQESGGRRLKRALIIKQNDIRILTDKELDEYEKFEPLSDYIKSKRSKYEELNKGLSVDSDSLLKGFQITNCDLFMRYSVWLLTNNPEINKDMTLMVRQLAPNEYGLPIEIYVFTATTVWVEFERIASEVFNMLISNVKNFGLTVFESGSGSDPYDVYLHQDNKLNN